MADFSFASACARAVAKVADKTWINAFACRATAGGKYAVRVQRPMSHSNPGNGGYVEITDDATT